ncbi:HEXXH motif domain-containing protein [Paractinoplanes lichenicola]|uniref:Tetratricopeptide repeat protein n=1 Tax=Paractinoplanes lichenicola TaxID=2802976 RepID=A0ABS1VIC4_9ACTN|nr:HEXXH motif-containing putative peptide modification protein [Actinoplanes lichenicola]MBL7254241.1 tetratricopeptide repeat protein [Actinoplanes lichenicola]
MTLERQVATVPGRTSTRLHRVTASDFEELTHGRGTAATVQRLAVTERSARMVVLYGLLHTLFNEGHDAGPLASPESAWQLLTAAEKADPVAAEQVLMYPLSGIWAAHLYRRLRKIVPEDAPLWLDIGYLHAMAATGAIRAGIDFSMDIPVRDGVAVLPGLGYATFAGLDAVPAHVEAVAGTVTVTVGDQRVLVAPGETGWHPAVLCVAETAGTRLEFVLDDVHPYRNLRNYSAAEPLSAEDVSAWRSLTVDAWAVLVEQDRTAAESVAASLALVAPIPKAKRHRPLSASCDEAFAAVVASMPEDAEQLASTMVHETQHVRLGAALHLFRFVEEKTGSRVYAPWRDDPRPLAGLIQGIYAFIGITGFFRGRDHAVARYEFALWRYQLHRVLAGIDGHPGLTPLGRQLVRNLAQPVEQWMTEPVEPAIRARAEAAAADHYGQWRCHHLPVPPEAVDDLAEAWRAGLPCVIPPEFPDREPVVDREVGRLDSRAVLARVRLGRPQEFEDIRAVPADVAEHVPGALAGDVHLVAGEYDEARTFYEAYLDENPGDARAWLGLGLSMAALGEEPAFLLGRPEVVRAVALRIAARGEGASARSLVRWFERR